MAKKIEKLTPQQERDLIAFQEEMWRQGTSCLTADRAKAEAAISDAYKVVNLPPPKFFWMPSPMTCALALYVLGKFSENAQKRPDGLRAGLRDGLGDGLGDGLRDGLWAGLRAGLRDGLGDGLRAGLRDGLRDGLRAGKIPSDQGDTYWWGQMDTFWLSYYRFGSMVGCPQKADLLSRLDIMERIAANCGFWYPRDGICVVSDRFASVSWDESRNRQGMPFRLHSDDKQAVSFRDGWGLYYWHGYRLPDTHTWIIADKARITAAAIMAEPNAELRRIMCEVSGFAPIVDIAKVVAEDRDGNGHPRRLLQADIAGETIRIVDVLNGSLEPDGSRRRFLLGAMPGATPHECVAASYGVNPKYYREAVRT